MEHLDVRLLQSGDEPQNGLVRGLDRTEGGSVMTEDPITWDKIKAFIDHTGHENYFDGRWTPSDSDLKFGDLVVTGLQCGSATDMAKYVGRVVQIRIGQGAFGSDVWLLRHPDGTLLSHENQGFWKLPPPGCRGRAHQILHAGDLGVGLP